jgi:hypothetical protein
MSAFGRTVISLHRLKEALLYFDYVIPVNLGEEGLRESLRISIPENLSADEFYELTFPQDRHLLYPPDLAAKPEFERDLGQLNAASMQCLNEWIEEFRSEFWPEVKNDFLDMPSYQGLITKLSDFLRKYRLEDTAVDASGKSVRAEQDQGSSEIAVTLMSLHLIDARHSSWEQLSEFRRDPETRDKLRRLRLFAQQNYKDKSKDFIEDDILTRIGDYDEAVKKWGFETKYANITALLNSKLVQGGLAGSLISGLLHEPVAAVSSAVGALTIELGRTALEISKQRFVLREIMRNNPVSYISYAKESLRSK